jgi:hypothetical protein
MSVTSAIAPLGMWKVLLDCCPVSTKACLFLSSVVLTLDVAAVSATTEGMDQSLTPALTCCSFMLLTLSLCSSSCSSTWQVGGVLLDNIE